MTSPAKVARDVLAELLYRAGATRPKNARRLSIATFHRVLTPAELADYPLPGIAVTSDELEWFLRLFQEHFECGPLEPIHRRWVAGEIFAKPPLALTFDDAQRDNFTNARPVLDRVGVRATFFAPTAAVETGELLWHDRAAYGVRALAAQDSAFVTASARGLGVEGSPGERDLPGAVVRALKRRAAAEREAWISDVWSRLAGRRPPTWDGMMTFDELALLAEEGHEIGSHSHSHPILPTIDDASLREELEQSRATLEKRLKRSVTSLCYPNGDADARVVQAARVAGYQRAVTTRWGWNARGADPFLLERCDMTGAEARASTGQLSRAQVAFRMSGLYPGLR